MPTTMLDPRLGNRRRKALMQQIAQQAIQRSSALSRFAKLGVGRGTPRASNAPRAFGAPRIGGGAPAVIQPRGFGANPQARFEVPRAQAGSRAAIPTPVPAPIHAPTIPLTPTADGGLQGVEGAFGTDTPVQVNQSRLGDPEYTAFVSGQMDVDPFGVHNDVAGYVPLGGGRYLDPMNGRIYGSGGQVLSGRLLS